MRHLLAFARPGWPAFLAVLLLALASACAAAAASGERRVALVLGNGAYHHTAKLANPANDARAVRAALQRLDFEVIGKDNLDKAGMERELRAFRRAAAGASIAVVFYAGHAMQVAGQNYVLPVSANIETEQDLVYEAITAETFLNETSGATGLRVVILDACRDNPFRIKMAAAMGGRSVAIGRGLRPIDAPAGTLIAYATRADDVAADGSGANSPFTTALLRHLETPGLDIRFLFGKVSDEVRRATGGKQEPAIYASLGGSGYFLRPEPPAPPPPTAAPDYEMAFWDAIKNSSNAADYRAYLETYPNGRFASLARVRGGAAEPPARPPATDAAARVEKPQPVKQDEARRAMEAALAGKDYALVLSMATKLAGEGDRLGDTYLAILYRDGTGVPRDYAKARELYAKAIEKGEPLAMTSLGWMHDNGRGGPVDYQQAAALYRRAIESGSATAYNNLGVLYREGKGVGKDPVESVRLFKAGAERGDHWSINNLGVANETGNGTPRDLQEALRLYTLGASKGNMWSKSNLAWFHLEGRGGLKKDAGAAVPLFKESAAENNAGGLNGLAWMTENGLGGLPKDAAGATPLYQRSANMGHAAAQFHLGRFLERGLGGMEQDVPRAIEWYEKAARNGNAQAARALERLRAR
jgi:TPR repeat protein